MNKNESLLLKRYKPLRNTCILLIVFSFISCSHSGNRPGGDRLLEGLFPVPSNAVFEKRNFENHQVSGCWLDKNTLLVAGRAATGHVIKNPKSVMNFVKENAALDAKTNATYLLLGVAWDEIVITAPGCVDYPSTMIAWKKDTSQHIKNCATVIKEICDEGGGCTVLLEVKKAGLKKYFYGR